MWSGCESGSQRSRKATVDLLEQLGKRECIRLSVRVKRVDTYQDKVWIQYCAMDLRRDDQLNLNQIYVLMIG